MSNALSPVLRKIPQEVRADLAAAAGRIATENLQHIAASRELLDRFQSAGVPLLFLKGATLGKLAYANPFLKAAIDIDLLVDPADLAKAAGLLRECGYRLQLPTDSQNDRVLHAWHRRSKESVWSKASPPLQLDLHTRVADNPRLIPGIDVHSASQMVDVGSGISLPTLADEELFAYLAVHGASSAWFRLKWITDFAGFLHGRDATAIERLYRRSQELGAGRAAGQALLVPDGLFGMLEQNAALREQLKGEAATRRLAEAALAQLTGDRGEPTGRPFGTMTIHRTQFALLPGLSYKLTELARQAGTFARRFR